MVDFSFYRCTAFKAKPEPGAAVTTYRLDCSHYIAQLIVVACTVDCSQSGYQYQIDASCGSYLLSFCLNHHHHPIDCCCCIKNTVQGEERLLSLCGPAPQGWKTILAAFQTPSGVKLV